MPLCFKGLRNWSDVSQRVYYVEKQLPCTACKAVPDSYRLVSSAQQSDVDHIKAAAAGVLVLYSVEFIVWPVLTSSGDGQRCGCDYVTETEIDAQCPLSHGCMQSRPKHSHSQTSTTVLLLSVTLIIRWLPNVIAQRRTLDVFSAICLFVGGLVNTNEETQNDETWWVGALYKDPFDHSPDGATFPACWHSHCSRQWHGRCNVWRAATTLGKSAQAV